MKHRVYAPHVEVWVVAHGPHPPCPHPARWSKSSTTYHVRGARSNKRKARHSCIRQPTTRLTPWILHFGTRTCHFMPPMGARTTSPPALRAPLHAQPATSCLLQGHFCTATRTSQASQPDTTHLHTASARLPMSCEGKTLPRVRSLRLARPRTNLPRVEAGPCALAHAAFSVRVLCVCDVCKARSVATFGQAPCTEARARKVRLSWSLGPHGAGGCCHCQARTSSMSMPSCGHRQHAQA